MSDAAGSSIATTARHGGDLDVHEDHQEVRRSRRLAKVPPDSAGALGSAAVDVRDLYGGGSSAAERREMRRKSIFHYSIDRQLHGGGSRRGELLPPRRSADKHLSQMLPGLLQPNEYDLGTVNKVFASRWLSEHQVVMGTKCNKMLVLDVTTGQLIRIPSLMSSFRSQAAECPCGIHAIACNPSKTLLATGGEHTNDLAVYRLPTFDPVFLGEEGHRDWIFDISWIDDEFCVTGSRDNKLALWRISPEDFLREDERQPASQHINSVAMCVKDSQISSDVIMDAGLPMYRYGKPVEVRPCASADKVRALAYNEQDLELGVLSLNSKIHIWDATSFQQKVSRKLPHSRENVCIAYDPQRRVYAVGSQSHVSIIDSRSLRHTMSVESKQKGSGVRSVGFNSNIVTIGTGGGSILFYDLMAGRYLDRNLEMGKGYLRRDETWREYFNGNDFANAVYTHCLDDSCTRLFSSGGPLPAGLWGNYAAVWQ